MEELSPLDERRLASVTKRGPPHVHGLPVEHPFVNRHGWFYVVLVELG